MALRDDFLAEVRAFLVASQMEPTAFGREVMNDPNFVFEVEHGRSVRLDTVEKVRGFMAHRLVSPPTHVQFRSKFAGLGSPRRAGESAAPSSPPRSLGAAALSTKAPRGRNDR
jgi:hypothetical protein